jgi:hypothetical protein
VLRLYRGLSPKERALVWAAVIAVVVLIVTRTVGSAGIVAGAQIAAAIGTLLLAGLAFAQVSEMRQARLAQERPHVIVDTDHTKPPLVYLVVRNIGRGAAKDISFEFSAPVKIPESTNNPIVIPVNEQPYFKYGMDYLAPGRELPTLWGSMPTLAPFLRDEGLQEGVTITSRYRSLTGELHTTEWTVNPLLMADRVSTREVGIQQLVEAVNQLTSDFNRVVSYDNNELYISTATEREQRRIHSDDEGRG